MEQYQEILEKVIRKEIITMAIPSIIILVVVVLIWLQFYRDFCSSKKRFVKSLMTSFIWIVLSVVLMLPALSTVTDAGKDIKEKSYKTYRGEYYIDTDDMYTKYDSLIERWIPVELKNNEVVYLYINNIFEEFQIFEGEYSGEIVYGQNSQIIVEIEKRD